MTATNDATADGSIQAGSRDKFFLGTAGLLLLIFQTGFSRTLSIATVLRLMVPLHIALSH